LGGGEMNFFGGEIGGSPSVEGKYFSSYIAFFIV
jgi:hypothetical protein